ncbi:hypothetical protein ACE83Q_00605 [Dellaglioa sp. P0083]|uniref:hypothetical protein n=1 Tax=Dellaglioa kimchii TaxID=3344667 RepID=UPI0038D39D03
MIAEDNYEQPVMQPGDKPTVVTASEHSDSLLRSAARSSYSMKAGDILVCYGSNSDLTGNIVGHAAIATSKGWLLEIPGKKYNKAKHTSKKDFFQQHTKKGAHVEVYRINKHPHYANDAAQYAWDHMYKKTNPTYQITTNLYHKSPSYCSKYVYLAYQWGATKKALTQWGIHIVTPHGLPGNFVGSFKPNYIHKITSY